MAKHIYKQAKNLMEERREAALSLNDIAASALCTNAQYSALMLEREKTMYDYMTALMANRSDKQLATKVAEIDNKLSQLAVKLGIITNNFCCKDCEDTGYVNGNKCACLKELIAKLEHEELGLQNLPQFTFGDHKEGLNAELDMTYAQMQKYCENFPNNKLRQITISGPVGVGKSCLVAAIANAVSIKNYKVQYISAFALNSFFIKFHTTPISERGDIFSKLTDCDMLIIDDLGTEPITNNVTVPYLQVLLDSRSLKHTLVTTNLDVHNELKNIYGERIYSRLCDIRRSGVMIIHGVDLRFKK